MFIKLVKINIEPIASKFRNYKTKKLDNPSPTLGQGFSLYSQLSLLDSAKVTIMVVFSSNMASLKKI